MSHGKVRAEGKVNPIWVPLCSCLWAESRELPRKKLGMEKKKQPPQHSWRVALGSRVDSENQHSLCVFWASVQDHICYC